MIWTSAYPDPNGITGLSALANERAADRHPSLEKCFILSIYQNTITQQESLDSEEPTLDQENLGIIPGSPPHRNRFPQGQHPLPEVSTNSSSSATDFPNVTPKLPFTPLLQTSQSAINHRKDLPSPSYPLAPYQISSPSYSNPVTPKRRSSSPRTPPKPGTIFPPSLLLPSYDTRFGDSSTMKRRRFITPRSVWIIVVACSLSALVILGRWNVPAPGRMRDGHGRTAWRGHGMIHDNPEDAQMR